MTFSTIENLSFAELKVQREELLLALEEAEHAELAARYLQARTDGKQRDEKLAEQGTTIKALQDGLALAQDKTASLARELTKAVEECLAASGQLAVEQARRAEEAHAFRGTLEELAAVDKERSDRLAGQMAEQTARAEAAEALAKARRAVLAKLMQDVAPLLAAE